MAAALALVGRHDPRATVADAAVAALLDMMVSHSASWDRDVWASVHRRGPAYVMELPFPLGRADADRVVCSWQGLFSAREVGVGLANLIAKVHGRHREVFCA